MKKFISCDWGTSAFRIRLIDSDHLEVISEVTTNDGIAGTYSRWLSTHRPAEERLMFYMSYLQEQLQQLKKASGMLLQDIPVIISGMASSTIGMIELPYKKLPFHTNGSDLSVRQFSDGKLIIVSGACTDSDVMRGEETMLAGCGVDDSADQQLLIFPGTHSKHIDVRNGMATDFSTYMTGEFFDVLANKSIIANSVRKPAEGQEDFEVFDEGVKQALDGNVLHEVFSVRARQVLYNADPEKNYLFLSGLLIGTELKSLRDKNPEKILLVSGTKLKRHYLRALHIVAQGERIGFRDADHALVRGHHLVCQHFAH